MKLIRRLLTVFSVLAGLVILANPVSADAAVTSTTNVHGPFPSFHADSLCGFPSGTVSGTGNSVFHVTINAAGDFWLTNTQEAWITFTPDDPSMPTFAGHVAAWFGVSDNNRNSVVHDTLNGTLTATDGSGASITGHAVDHLTVSASGQVTLFMACH
jgi:hypothetical protein